jgi:hypothetical protein
MFEIVLYTHSGLEGEEGLRALTTEKNIPFLYYLEDQAPLIEEILSSWGKTTQFNKPFIVYKTMVDNTEVCTFVEGLTEAEAFLNAL